MASSISQPVGIINGSNFVQPADVNEDDDFYMEDGAGGHPPEASNKDLYINISEILFSFNEKEKAMEILKTLFDTYGKDDKMI